MAKYAIGVDLGGTKIEAALVSSSGKIIKSNRIPTGASKGYKHVLAQIERAIDTVKDRPITGIGIGVPGFVDSKGNVFSLTNIKSWKKTNMPKALSKYKAKVVVANDADCFALSESKFGKGKKKSPLLGITLGTGVGGGLIVDGKILSGLGGCEIGHMMIDPSGPKHHSKLPGTIEAWCSGKSIEKAFKKRTGKKKTAGEIGLMKGRAAKEVISAASLHLAYALASFINGLSPRVIAIGGGASRVKGYVKPAIRKAKSLAFKENTKGLKIYVTKMDSGVIGAAALVL